MANTKVTQHVIANNAISAGMIQSAAVTDAKLHATLDLSGKTLTLPAVTLPSASVGTTQSASDNSTKLATTAYVETAISNLVDSSPSSLNTLNELAAALNDDASFSTTVTNSLATKLPLAGGTMTGNIAHAGDFTIDVGGDLILDADGENISFRDGGTERGQIDMGSGNFTLRASSSNSDMIFRVNDGGSEIVALTIDSSEAGFATFNDGGSFGGTGALKIPVGTTAQRPTAATGQLRFNSTDGKLEIYNGSAWANVSAGTSNKTLDTFTGDGSTTAFTLTETPANEDALMVFIDGAYQEKGDYSLSGKVLTLDVAPLSGEKIAVHTTIGAVHDGTAALNQQFTGDGSTTAFTLSVAPQHENNTQVYINGVYQQKTDYTVSGTTLTFDTAPTNGDIIEVNSFTVTNLGGSDNVTEGVSNLYFTNARARSAVSVSGNAISYNSSTGVLTANFEEGPVFTGTVTSAGLAVDTDTLVVDSSNNYVGIGTTSPQRELHVQNSSSGATSTSNSVAVFEGNDNTEVSILGGSSSVLALNFGHSGDNNEGVLYFNTTSGSENLQLESTKDITLRTTSTNATAGDINFKSYNTTIMTVDGQNNRVGIGEGSPSEELHVSSSDSGNHTRIHVTKTSTSGTAGISFNTTNSSNTWTLFQEDASASKFYVYDGADYIMTFDSANNKVIVGGITGSADGTLAVKTNSSTHAIAIEENSGNEVYQLGVNSSGDLGFFNSGSTTPSVVFDDSDNVGIGTTSPDRMFHVKKSDSSGTVAKFENSAGTVYVELNTNNQAGGDAGYLSYDSDKELGLWTDDTQQMTINSSGDVHFNHLSSDFRLRGGVYGSLFDSNPNMNHNLRYHATAGMYFNVGTTNGNFVFEQRGTGRFTISSSGGANGSDIKLKENVEDITYGLDTVKQLQPRKFDWKGEDIPTDEKAGIGFIAQEVEAIIPELVTENEHPDGTEHNTKMLNYSAMTSVLVKAVQEQQTIIEDLKSRIETLEG